jgi:hypothetical protein
MLLLTAVLTSFATLAQDRTRNVLQQMWADLPENTLVECRMYAWPGDEYLCDRYEGSDGERYLKVFEANGYILGYEDFGTYCQGDSEYGIRCYYDLNGNLVMREEGFNIYTEQVYTLFENGRFVSQHKIPSPYALDEIIEIDSNSLRPGNSAEVKQLVEEMKSTMLDRHHALLKWMPSLNEEELQAAQETIREIDHALKEFPATAEYVLRKPNETEIANRDLLYIAAESVSLFALPDLKSEILDHLHFYDCCVILREIGPVISSDASPRDQWVKVAYNSGEDENPKEAWLLRSNLMRNFFPR